MNIASFLKTWWPALLVLAIWIGLFVFEKYIRRDERMDVRKDVKIERLEADNQGKDEVIKIGNRQNEIRNNRADNDTLVKRLRDGSF